jgi:hypothetical protein
MNKDIKQLAEETLKKHVGNDTMPVKKVNILSAMVEMYTAGAREATNPELRSKQLKADLYLFRDMYCQNIDLSTIDEYVDGLATTTPLSSSSGDAPLNSNNSIQ